KLAFEAGLERNAALFFRFAGAVPLMALMIRGVAPSGRDRKVFLRAMGLGFIGIGIEATLFFVTLEHFGAALTGVFLYLYPAFVVLLSHFFLGERMNSRKGLSVVMALAGTVLTAGVMGGDGAGTVSPMQDPAGLGIGILTGAWYAVYLLAGARLTGKSDPVWVSSGVVTGSALVFGLLFFLDRLRTSTLALPNPTLSLFGVVAGLAVFSTALAFSTLYAGMKRVGAVRASLLSTFELVFTLVLAWGLLGERLTVWQGAGAVLILVSVVMTARQGENGGL
ncbi:MAG: hypothetical protein EBX52_01855, partial [Proteobacteria bacterium]|nr:hypothetical protein [Pseudomonadota bacterium]